ncbi:MAG: hypothetical protein KGP35_09715 [Bacteroidetes bacterium]|nr:hypothetical protein [Bacteroidota bacterium]
MLLNSLLRYFFFIFTLVIIDFGSVMAQRRGITDGINRAQQGFQGGFGGSMGGGNNAGPFKDSLLHRTGLEDSASILYRVLDEDRFYFQDSSVHDFGRRWPVKWTDVFLGNSGSAVRSLLFSPSLQAGWDHGMHAFAPYQAAVSQSRFYNVTRPFTELSYTLASKAEQHIGVFHTQNIRYNWNVAVDYRMLNAPGIFKNQKNSHNRYLINSWYHSKNNRYFLFIAAEGSRVGASENGGIKGIELLQQIPSYSDRFTLPTQLGGSAFESRNLLSNTINTGNIYKSRQLLIRNRYDFGKREEVMDPKDSSVAVYFTPRLRWQHTYEYREYSFRFLDTRVDSTSYANLYGLTGRAPGSSFSLEDRWVWQDNALSLLIFPDLKNPQHQLKLGGGYQQIEGNFGAVKSVFNQYYLDGTYANKTRSGKWDFEWGGKMFVAGAYAGDYQASVRFTRLLGKRNNLLTLEGRNVNRTPSFVHNDLSNFKIFNRGNTQFGKENTSVVAARYQIPHLNMEIGFSYYALSNYVYFNSYRTSVQESKLFNVARINASRKFQLNKAWSWYADAILQQATPNAPVNLPLVLTRSRIAYEGKYFKNLNLCAGLEARYMTAFKADGYSPVLGQFFLQQDTVIHNCPDVTAFVHFRIRSWYLFLRAENLNSVSFSPQFGFFDNNFAAPSYPMPGLLFRMGLFWGMVN